MCDTGQLYIEDVCNVPEFDCLLQNKGSINLNAKKVCVVLSQGQA